MTNKITITIKKSIWKLLVRLKLSKDFKTFDDVLDYLLRGDKK
jgi:predicted CopG family antitoxin